MEVHTRKKYHKGFSCTIYRYWKCWVMIDIKSDDEGTWAKIDTTDL